ncbi:GTPase HflX [Methanolapillus millepedarum]|uniref:GTPase HflX n=2 Tax=Methanolapillus millepedarum TaxID=3028296 RepID=A0AA96V3N1_9EURY|nr:GTPase HflX [Methanosarcinaceae archaeon Ac7]
MRISPNSDADKNARKAAEFVELAKALDYKVADTVVQERYPDRKYNVGSGKAREVAILARDLKATQVIFYDPLSTSQIYNISKLCGEAGAACKVIDRFQLILDIFAERATTHRSKLQVELARLRYELPSAKMLIALSKKEERAGWGGLGDYEDSYEQDIKKRISRIETELAKADLEEEARRLYRHKRGFFMISLAGYTNAGKSTLFNALVDENAESKDMFFTTLIPKTRALEFGKRKILLTDTVGFIEDLPHFLVDAFRSTLEGIYFSDMILLVVDFSEPADHIRDKLITCHETLWEKGTSNIITVLNKSELVSKKEQKQKLEELEHLILNPVFISAKNKTGLDKLLLEIDRNLPQPVVRTISLPNTKAGASALSWFYENGIVDEILYGKYMTFEFCATDDVMAKTDDVLKKAEEKGVAC